MKRLRTLAMITIANGVVIFSVLYYEWTLLEATLAYIGEFLILGLVNSGRFLAASQLPRSAGGSISPWKLRGAKAVNVLMSLAMCTLFSALPLGILYITGTLGENAGRLVELWRPLALCWAGFVATHVVAFVEAWRVRALIAS